MKSMRPGCKVLAIASGGGHWVQLMRLRPALEGMQVAYVMVSPMYRVDIGSARHYVVNDATVWQKTALARMALRILWILVKERPDCVISTGAAPGYFGLRLGKLVGARTIWVDSIANAEKLSRSGMLVGRFADLWLTQWPHLARQEGPHYHGAVL